MAANQAPNSRISDFLSNIIDSYCDISDHKYECKSSEEMRNCLETFNNSNDTETKKKPVAFSMDAKKLFPSMKVGACMRSVHHMIENNDIIMKNVNWWEVAKYISVCPKRVLKSRVKLKMN